MAKGKEDWHDISVKGPTHGRIKKGAAHTGETIRGLVDRLVNEDLDEKGVPRPVDPAHFPPQHLTF